MTKAEIIREICRKTGVDQNSALSSVEAFMDTVKDSLISGENVYLRGFGSFLVVTRKAKTARIISRNTTIIIPEHKVPAFKPADSFKEALDK